jgi:hypothetical protein
VVVGVRRAMPRTIISRSTYIPSVVRELYDVAFIPRIRNPSAIGFKTDEILRIITIDES